MSTPISDLPTVGLPAGPAAPALAHQEQFGEYLLIEEIGRGGMGVVYRAYEASLARHVAVKMILSQALADPADLQRFRAEASAAGRLSHPNIVSVHRVGELAGRHFYAMDLISGQSLAQRLAGGPLPGKVAARYLVTVARAIHHAHQQGLLHRDIKPGNILLDEHDAPHVTDFGLAKHLSTDNGQTRTGAILGTPGYMSPEQASGKKELGPAADVYGLGAVLYECLTARPPFRGETALDTLLMVMDNDPAPPRLLNPHVDRDLETICLKALARDPRDRYASAAELADDLERYLAGESIQARSLNMIEYIGRSLERSQFDVEFRQYGNMLLIFAAIVVVAHGLKQVVAMMPGAWPPLLVAIQVVQFMLLVVVLWWHRVKGIAPATTAERQLYSLIFGYMLACVLSGVFLRLMFRLEVADEGKVYPFYCAITGMAYFVLGSSYWGKCYAIGVGFFLLGLGLSWQPTFGAVAFGGAWAVALAAIGLRLRSLGSLAGERKA